MRDFDKYIINKHNKNIEDLVTSNKRLFPVSVSSIKGKSIITVLEDSILQWPPRDLRLEPSYIEMHDTTEDTSDSMLKDIAESIDFKIERRNIIDNSIIIAVRFQHNISEFERYDKVVSTHNEEWLKAGEPEDIFDPKTGDIMPIEDKFVVPSRYEGINPFGDSNGKLSKAKPTYRKKKYLELTYRLDIKKSIFILGYVAKDLNNNILFYNEIEGDNLTYLVRRSIQELFGNPCVHSNVGPFYEGITMLINGKKNKGYYVSQKKPYWLEGTLKDVAVKLAVMSAESSTYKLLGNLIRSVGLIFGILAIIGYSFYAFGKCPSEDYISGWQVILVICGILTIMYLFVRVSSWLLRKAYNVEIESKFI